MSEIICKVCPHHCHIPEGKTGLCRARRNVNGKNICDNYGKLTALAMDPIEKKPLVHYYPGSYILSVGSYGCNLACPFCQNASISMVDENNVQWRYFSPEDLCRLALTQKNNIGLAFTYNEPLISFEYIKDCAEILHKKSKKIVLVSNGNITPDVMKELMPYTDAMNIDLKGDACFYKQLQGDYETVRNTIAYVYDKCHLEVTTLLIPGKNDNSHFIETDAQWLSHLDKNIVLHLSRYFPRYHYDIPPTDVNKMKQLQRIAQKYLNYVYLGNV